MIISVLSWWQVMAWSKSKLRGSQFRDKAGVRSGRSKSGKAHGLASIILKPIIPIGMQQARDLCTREVGPDSFFHQTLDQEIFSKFVYQYLEESVAFKDWWNQQVLEARHFVIQVDEPLAEWDGGDFEEEVVIKYRFYFVVTDFCVLCVGVDYMDMTQTWKSTGTVYSSYPLHYVEAHAITYVLVGVEDFRRRVNWDRVECQNYELTFEHSIAAATHSRNAVHNHMFYTVIPFVEKIVSDMVRSQAGNVDDIVPVFLVGYYNEVGDWTADNYQNVVTDLASLDKWYQVNPFRSGAGLPAYTQFTTRWFWENNVSPSWSMLLDSCSKMRSQSLVVWKNKLNARPSVKSVFDPSGFSEETYSESSWPELRGFATQYFDNIGMFVPNLYTIDVVGTELLIQLIHLLNPGGAVEGAMLGMVLLDKAAPYDTLQEELGWEVIRNMPFPGLVKTWIDHAKRVTKGMLWPKVFAFGRTVKPIVSPSEVASVQSWYRDNVANQNQRHGRTYRPYSGLPVVDFKRDLFEDLLKQLLEKGYVKPGFVKSWNVGE